MNNFRYAVIILNYNTVDDAIQAIESINRHAKEKNYIICLADNNSSISRNHEILDNLDLENTITYKIESNKGYAAGNNAAFTFLRMQYDFKYTIIMNPDIIIETYGIIDDLLDSLEKMSNNHLVGVQPLVNNIDDKRVMNQQVNIRRVGSYSDVLLRTFTPMRYLFVKKSEYSQYKEEIPYIRCFSFEVPSGAFFIIRTEAFENVEMFDERTFLYGEEEILGFKLKKLGQCFLFNPDFYVNHYQGKSTGSHNGKISKLSLECTISASLIYLKYYLKSNWLQILIVKILIYVNYFWHNCIDIIKIKVHKER